MKTVVSLSQIDAILLTAGASKRLGEPKALVDIHGESLIQILIRKLKQKKLRIIIVTRAELFYEMEKLGEKVVICLLYTSPSPRDLSTSRMPSSA